MRVSTQSAAVGAALLLTACTSPDETVPQAGSPPMFALERGVPVDHTAGLAREPMIVETADGALLVSGYGEERPTLWRSDDGGATWDSVHVGTADDGALGNSDVDLAIAPDGTLHLVVMSFDRQTFEGTGIRIATSRDGGDAWSWAVLSNDRFDDRPWVEVAPDGTAHVIWNDGAGVSHSVSTDGGRSWTERRRIHDAGGSSHMAIGPDGTIAVRITPLSASGNRHDPGVDHLAVSTDGGASWALRALPGTRTWSEEFDPAQAPLRWVEPLAWDAAGALWSLWTEGDTLRLARSGDRGATWTQWPVAHDGAGVYFPYLVANGAGELVATWFSGFDDALRTHVAYVQVVDAGPPLVADDGPMDVPSWRSDEPDDEPVRDTAGEYVPAIFLRDGRIAIVTTIQDPAADRWGFTFRPYTILQR